MVKKVVQHTYSVLVNVSLLGVVELNQEFISDVLQFAKSTVGGRRNGSGVKERKGEGRMEGRGKTDLSLCLVYKLQTTAIRQTN